MSEHQLMRRNSIHSVEEDNIKNPILAVYEAVSIDQIKIQEKLKKIYTPLQYPLCNSYVLPDMAPIRQRKKELDKNFLEEAPKVQNSSNIIFDGLYQSTKISQQSTSQSIRQQIRMVRDAREQFYEENGEFIIEKQLFSDQLSKLANISFENNACLQSYQKNAILSERNNQKKLNPFQIELQIAGIWLNKHELNNQEEKKFEQLRPALKQWAFASVHPVLPQLSKELQMLNKTLSKEGPDVEQIQKKIRLINKRYGDQKLYIETLMKKIIHLNNELKDIRKRSGMQTVPWKVQVKEYDIDGKPSYDIGVIGIEVNEKLIGNNQNQIDIQQKRREQIKSQVYFLKIYANNYQVGRSQKFNLQWPSFKVAIVQKFNIMVYTAPATIKVQIIKNGFINKIIDVIYLSVPGLHAKTITSTQKKYAGASFASNGKQFRKNGKEDEKGDEHEKIAAQAPSGVLLYKMQWKGESSKMPSLATKTAEEQTACTEETEVDDQSQIDELFDAKDPRVPHKSHKERVDGQIKKSSNALLPFVDVQSARHLLLKYKSMLPELQKVQIPLRQQEINNRQDLLQIIRNQQDKQFKDKENLNQNYFNPLDGIFSEQPEIILQEIAQILKKIKILKGLTSGSGGGNIRYKITEQIINEYIFEQMESPIVIFFKNLFTQKRKLGPQASHRIQAKSKIDQMQINLHIRSAKNVPIRESSFERIKNFQQQQNKFKQQQFMIQYNNNAGGGIFDKLGGYGQGFFRQQPSMNMQGNNFFNAMQNQGRHNQEVTYNEHINLDRVNGFIQMRFKNKIKRTRCFEGPYPQWNQTLCLNYSMKHQQTNIDKILLGAEKQIKVFAFDMIEQSKPTQAISEARVKKTKFYMGRIDIPFSFIIAVPSISGLFKLDRPLIGFGYGIKRAGLFDFDNDPQEMNKTENPDLHTYINLDLFTEPLIDSMIAYNSDRKFVPRAGQNPLVLQRASDWLDQLNTKRYVRLWLNNIQGKSVFICRYLSDDISPPKLMGDHGSGSMIQRSARFVSLIPKKYNCKLLQGTQQFHMNCNQFLNVKMGEDHGILLCNYFNFIDRVQGKNYQSMLLICKAFPYGKCIFVLRRDRETKNCEIWDPFKGESYFIPAKEYDTFCCFIRYQKQPEHLNVRNGKDNCPIIEVSCIVSKDNVYFNIQQAVKPPQIDFNIEDDKCWKPFLTQRTRNQLFQKGFIETIQGKISESYYPQMMNLQSHLETELNRHISERLESERKNHFQPYTFKIHSRITNLITNKLLPLCQTFKVDHRIIGSESPLYKDFDKKDFEQSVSKIQEERDKIKNQIPNEKNLFGFTLNMTFTTLNEVYQKIADTQIHLDENSDIQFVLGIKCFEYPCHLISVWIFIGTIG